MKLKTAVITLAGLLGIAAAAAVPSADFYVAPKGDNSGSGAEDEPLATLEAARDAARKAGAGPHRILLLPGDYFLAKTFTLNARDNGLTIEAAGAGRVTLYGGRLVRGWRRDGETFWCADLPGVKEGAWDFRALLVNGRMADPARMPESGAFEHQSVFDVQWLSSVGGGWARPPTQEEFTTLRYDPKDIPPTLNVGNAEVRVYHMWYESRVGVVTNDAQRHALILQKPAKPPGAFGVKKYVIFNTREGMTRPGQWYLDRAAGRVVYWPLPGEDMATAKVVAPVLERILGLVGPGAAPVEKITVRGLSLQATTPPLQPGGFGAAAFDGAVHLEHARQCTLENLEIANVAGQGVQALALAGGEISDCRIHDTGACAIRAGGSATLIARNHLYRVGLIYPSAVALVASHDARAAGEKGFHIYRNEIHDAPYCGINCNGAGNLIEENLIYRVMREESDGAAIYGTMRDSVLRGNCVRDVVKMVKGYGVSSFYLDEGSADCVIERNVSVGVERPVHNHIARNVIIRDNVFMVESNMALSFPRSSGCTFADNTLFVPGKITIERPPAIKLWTNNVIFHGGAGQGGSPQAFTIDDAMPSMPPPERQTSPISVEPAPHPPSVNGAFNPKEWPDHVWPVAREVTRWGAGGAPVFASFTYDDQCLYVAVNVILFDVTTLRQGSSWGQDDRVEICVGGTHGVFVIHGFANGMKQSVTDGGASAEAAASFGQAVRFAAQPYGGPKAERRGGWRCQWAIPFDALGIKPSSGLKIPFNIGIYRVEDNSWRCLEGTLAENWRLEQAATLQLK